MHVIAPPLRDALLAPHRFTWDEVLRFAETDAFGEGVRVELIGGDVYTMPEEGFLNVDVVRVLQKWLLASLLALGFEIAIREPIHLPDGSVLIPDLSVFPAGARAADMQAERALLIIEVADATLERDRKLKLPRYAEAGVAEVWLVEAQTRAIVAHRAPLDGAWTSVARFTVGQSAAPACAAQAAFELAALPPPAA
jgi:Uma2 family endonuclease